MGRTKCSSFSRTCVAAPAVERRACVAAPLAAPLAYQRDWQFVGEQPASVSHMRRIVPHTVPLVSRSNEHLLTCHQPCQRHTRPYTFLEYLPLDTNLSNRWRETSDPWKYSRAIFAPTDGVRRPGLVRHSRFGIQDSWLGFGMKAANFIVGSQINCRIQHRNQNCAAHHAAHVAGRQVSSFEFRDRTVEVDPFTKSQPASRN